MAEESGVIAHVPIDRIRPDSIQPRRLLPRELAEALAGGTLPLQVLNELRKRGRRVKWIRERVDELDALADSIATDGLMEPIRVLDCGDGSLLIEEGERRWWAHHILLERGDSRFEKISAIVVEKEARASGLLRRRVAENVMRSGFTVIELAHALETRINEVGAAEPQLSRRETERRVGKENGMSDRRVRQYVALLKLPTKVREIAQEQRLSEGVLRRIAAMKDSAHQIGAALALTRSSTPRLSRNTKADAKASRRSGRKVQRNSRISRRVLSIPHIKQLINLAKRVDAHDVFDAGEALGRRLSASLDERRAISNLRAALTKALSVSVRQKSPQSNQRVRQRGRRTRNFQ